MNKQICIPTLGILDKDYIIGRLLSIMENFSVENDLENDWYYFLKEELLDSGIEFYEETII